MSEHSSTESQGPGGSVHLDEDTVLDLIQGLLSPSRREQAIAHASCCPACERLLQERVTEREGLRARRRLGWAPDGKLTVELRGSSVSSDARVSAGHTERGARSGWWENLRFLRSPGLPRMALALAAAAVLVMVLLWPRGSIRPAIGPLYWVELAQNSEEGTTLRGVETEEGGGVLAAGVAAYERRDLETAIRRLSQVKCAGACETYRRIYLASALAHRGSHAEALALLQDLPLEIVPGEWGREGRWTMLVCLQALGRRTSADSLVRLLSTEDDEVGQRAREFLRH